MHEARRRCSQACKPGVGAAAAEKASPTLVTVNGKAINSQMLDTFLQAVTGKPAAEATKEQKDALLEQLVNMTLAAQAAEKDGLAATRTCRLDSTCCTRRSSPKPRARST